LAFGGGDVAPVESVVVTPAPVPEVSSPIKFYIGGGYAAIDADGSGVGEQQYETDDFGSPGLPHSYNIDANNYLLLAGVKFNPYFAIEGRYWNSIDDFDYKYTSDGNTTTGSINDGEVESYGIYAKPMYPATEQVDVYGLLGYANTKISGSGGKLMDDGDFSWGLGASYDVNENLSVFADFVRLYDDTVNSPALPMDGDDVTVDSINVGLIYTF
jgi:opacity protein-like surface antigen